ncbi:MAG: Na/Pi cotransporter family protein, partial [Leptolyngbya sp. SIO3F4]|nr:Na/Pi cotransporter family protein [Leptolyngbya sp. SIO3F4]
PSSPSDSNPIVEADEAALDNTDSTATETGPAITTDTSAAKADSSAEPEVPGSSWLYAGGALLAVYGLFASIDLLDVGFQSILGPQAEALLILAANPWLGLLLGILATALIQSSSIVTTLLVALVANGFPIATAIPMVMGANLGTTITNTLVSLGYLGNDDEFERGFAAATIHDCFNLVALVIFFPLELLLHPLERLTQWLSTQGLGLDFLPENFISPIDWLVQPTRWLIAYGVNTLHGPWDSLLLFGISVGGVMVSVTTLGWLLKHWLNAPTKEAIYWAMGHGSKLGSLATGMGITALLQSSSITTSLMVPLAGSGTVALKDIYPFVLGANIGTCITALLATLAVDSPAALQLALVHLSYNLLAVTLIFSLPLLRNVPLTMAQRLATIAKNYRFIAVAYVVGVFFLLPFLALWMSSLVLG